MRLNTRFVIIWKFPIFNWANPKLRLLGADQFLSWHYFHIVRNSFPSSAFCFLKATSKSCYLGFSKSFENCQVWLATKNFNSIEKNQKFRLKPLFFIPPTPLATLFFFSFLFYLILCFLLSYLPSSMFFYPHKQ